MFEHVTLFAAGYLRTSKRQTWRGGGHNILGQVLGEYRLRMKRRCTLVTDWTMMGHAAKHCSCTKLLQRGMILSVNHYLILCQL